MFERHTAETASPGFIAGSILEHARANEMRTATVHAPDADQIETKPTVQIETPNARKPSAHSKGLRFVAGVGFEPTTFGL